MQYRIYKFCFKLHYINILSFKKGILPFLESLIEAKLVQGNTIVLTRRIESRECKELMFNFKIQSHPGPIKLVGRYRSEENFINCLQNVPSGPSTYFSKYKNLLT